MIKKEIKGRNRKNKNVGMSTVPKVSNRKFLLDDFVAMLATERFYLKTL